MALPELGINTGFALNRYPAPEQWMRVVGKELGLRYVQLTADLLNPSLGEGIIKDLIARIHASRKKYGIVIESVMTGAFTRVNHFSHPDPEVRDYWKAWFRELADIAVAIGAENLSSHLGILCYDDLHDSAKKKAIEKETIRAWKELAAYGKKIGLQSLSWEPMSIRREYGETIEEARRIQGLLEGSAIPIRLCLDVDHGDVASENPDDNDYTQWIAAFRDKTSHIHLKQSLADKGSHYPFIERYNKIGRVTPARLLDALNANRREGTRMPLLLLELSFREREPADSLVLAQLKESVKYWKTGMMAYEIKL